MKLLVVVPYFYPKMGGLENYAYNFCIGLKKQYKWEIVVITSNHKGKKDVIETIKGLKIYRLARWFKLSNTPVNPLWYWKIKKIIKFEKPNIINAHTPVPFIADLAALATKNIPFILTYHAFSLYKHNFTAFNILIHFYKFFEKLLFKRADKIIIVSDIIKSAISDEFKNKVSVIYNAVPLNGISKPKKITNYRSPSIVFISNLDKSHAWKGLKEILISLKLYKDENKSDNINLYIIGDGDFKYNYKKLVRDLKLTSNVKFLGAKNGKFKNNILKKASLAIIYPQSSNDAFPTVALEYWANRLPIIASDIIPINKLFKNKKTAYLIKPKSPSILAKAIKFISENKEFAEKLTKNGYEELKKNYILEHEIKKFYFITKNN